MKNFLFVVVATALAFSPASHSAALSEKSFHQRPKLVVVIAIDQMRADYLTRFSSRFLEPQLSGGKLGGFRFLMNRGAYYPFAQYDVLQNMTGPGHAMILSGSYPYQMGISLNDWYEPGKGPIYCVRDDASPLVTGTSSVPGLSPRNFLGTTVGDELKNAGHASRVVTVALKDRAAILLGGHRADLALWFDLKSMQWTTSRHYIPEGKMPDWIDAVSRRAQARKGSAYKFESSGAGTGLSHGKRPTFSYSIEYGSYASFSYPMGVELTIEAAQAAISSLQLGRGRATDLFAMSFSSHDYLAHAHGVNSRELEEMTLAEDKLLSGFFNFLQKQLPNGLDDVVIVLTADHGGPSDPDWIKSHKMAAGRIDEADAARRGNERLSKRFGAAPQGRSYIPFVADLNFFLDPEVLRANRVDPTAAEAELKQELLQTEGVLTGFTKTEHRLRQLPPVLFERQALKGYQPSRSGDVVLIPRPHYQSTGAPVSHQTGYTYDRTVPLLISGKRIKPGVYSERADVVDIAPTLSFLLGIFAPAMSEGRVLSEMLIDSK